ncbi:MAG: NusG domain II-containing protein [Clostridia bacterium]|nr:NusG domain II-containing protein [Clostridia bacterium]
MNKSSFLIITLILLTVFSAVAIFIRAFYMNESKTAQIYQNGELIREIELDTVDSPIEFDITDSDGHINTVRAEKGKIRMLGADCPDKLCVNRGWIKNSVVPVVCLPNKVTIEIVGTKSKEDARSGGIF